MDSLAADIWRQCEVGESLTLRRAEDRDREAEFVALVGREARFLYRVAYSILRNVQDAEDVVQEAFLKLYRTGAWRGMKEERAYLARVVWRIAVGRLPRREMVEAEGEVETLVSRDASPESLAVDRARETQMRRMIAALPEELRQALVLSALEEMSSRDVALMMGIPEGTVRTRVMRAKVELRRRFEAAQEVRR
jgi:RNA polymerase sigma-70 factor (ECF subfamily)